LILQGAGIGIIYLTLFAAAQLFNLIPRFPAQLLMVVLVMLASALAVLQNALGSTFGYYYLWGGLPLLPVRAKGPVAAA
jgi:uncharacterized membrane protein